jgi:hypothetical protein
MMTGCFSSIPSSSSVQLNLDLSDVAMDALHMLSQQSGLTSEELASDLLTQHLGFLENALN